MSSDLTKPGATIKILCTVGVQALVEQIAPEIERRLGRSLAITFGVASVFKKNIEAGEEFDLGIFTRSVIDELIAAGRMAAALRVDIARSGIGLAVAAGTPKPDITTLESFKRTLRDAPSIVTTKTGISGIYFVEILKEIGLYEEVCHKLTLDTTRTLVAELLAEGVAQYAVQLMSELLPVPGADVIGPIPNLLQRQVVLTGGVSTGSRDPASAAKILEILTSPEITADMRLKGLEPA